MRRPGEMSSNDFRASVIAMVVRNAIEDIHANPDIALTDDVMAEMNRLTRRAIWEALEMLDNSQLHEAALAWTVRMVPEYWEPPSSLPPLGNLELAGKPLPTIAQPSDASDVTVQVTVPVRGPSYFTCPNCGRRISFNNKYPFGWQWKVCPGCRFQWVRMGGDIGPRREDLPAGENQGAVRVGSSGRPVG